jgi:hypothetical protein
MREGSVYCGDGAQPTPRAVRPAPGPAPATAAPASQGQRGAVAIDHRLAEPRLDPRLPGGVQGDERLDAVRGLALAPRVDHRRAASAAFTAAIVLAAI